MRKFILLILAIVLVPVSISAKNISPVILTIKNYPMSEEEKAYLEQVNPYGFIFIEQDFRKHIDFVSLKQELTDLLGHKIYFFVDQEGGSVNRLKHLFPEKKFPSAAYYGAMVGQRGLMKTKKSVFIKARETARLLASIGMDVNLAPNAEINPYGQNKFFKTRLYSQSPRIVRELSEAFAQGTKAGGIEPCYKHFPGTARSQLDPHKLIPVIKNVTTQDLTRREFIPFKPAQNYNYLMMGHALYPQIDKSNISTFNPVFYQFVRENLNFQGLIITDALNMRATGKISIGDKIALSLSAGSDLAMPFFDYDMPFDERLEELNKIPPEIIEDFNNKLEEMEEINPPLIE